MPFGILEAFPFVAPSQPPGTSLPEDVNMEQTNPGVQDIMSPDSRNTPHNALNLSSARKEILFIVIIFGACLTGVIGPLLVPGFVVIATAFNTTLTNVALLNGSLIMALGVSSYMCCCLAVVYGKRLIYLITTIVLIVSCIWGAASKSYGSLLASRVFQGLGMGGFYALAGTASINDVFLVHQRGTRVGLWNFAVIVSVNATPIISGYVIVELGWRWAFGLLAICFGLLLVGIFFFFPETTLDRQRLVRIPVLDSTHSPESLVPVKEKDSTEKSHDPPIRAVFPVHIQSDYGNATRWKRSLGLQALSFSNQSRLLPICLAPFKLLRRPAVLWACAMWSVTFTWVILQGAVASQIFQAPPYNLSPQNVGNLIGIAPLIGSALGTISSGLLSDWISRRLAVRNAGAYEPEFRLLILIPFVITISAGTFGLGMAIETGQSYIICGVFLAILNFAIGVGCTAIVSYLNDITANQAGEAFGITMLVKSAFAFGLTFMLNDFYAKNGPRVFFFTFGSLTLGVTALAVPLYIYGKRIRAWEISHGIV